MRPPWLLPNERIQLNAYGGGCLFRASYVGESAEAEMSIFHRRHSLVGDVAKLRRRTGFDMPSAERNEPSAIGYGQSTRWGAMILRNSLEPMIFVLFQNVGKFR
jgi:hypothetical protein